jgi:hypothetical protein
VHLVGFTIGISIFSVAQFIVPSLWKIWWACATQRYYSESFPFAEAQVPLKHRVTTDASSDVFLSQLSVCSGLVLIMAYLDC